MAGQSTRASRATVGNRRRAVGSDHGQVKVDEALAGNSGARRTHAVRGMAGGATETRIDVQGMLREARIGHDLSQIVAFPAERVGTINAKIRRGK